MSPFFPVASPRPLFLVLLWVFISNLFNLSSKHISSTTTNGITGNNTSWVFTTMIQLAFASLFGFILTAVRKPNIRWRGYLSSGLASQTLPVGIALAVANGSMMFALSRTSVAVFQTVKASSPLFTSIACHMILNRRYTTETYISLIPILFGLLLATLSDIRGDIWGFSACIVSSLAQVFINLSVKSLIDKEWIDLDQSSSSPPTTTSISRKIDPLEMQFMASVMGFIASFYMFLLIFMMNAYGGNLFSVPEIDIFSLNALTVFVNVILYNAENIVAYLSNASMNRLPFAVSDAIRRLSIVTFSNIAANIVPTITNMFGVLCVAIGSIWFTKVVKEIEPSSSSNNV
jgi:solute carrier family 35 protein E1